MKRSLATDIGMARARRLVGRRWKIPEDIVIVGARLSLDAAPELLDDSGVWHPVDDVLAGEEVAR